jgi:Fic-DOC domain mobile mystery protein B
VTDLFQEPSDATPLDPSLRNDLLQTWITNRRDLNEAEQENIVRGAAWARRRRAAKITDLLNDEYARTLHNQMFGEVWKWAGTYRKNELNIGIAPHLVPAEMADALDDARFWVDRHTFPSDEIAVRLHHRLTQIHPFANGNGRHSRMMADLLIEHLGGESFTWGAGHLADVGELRKRYIDALRAADNHDIVPLMNFVRS